MIKFKRFAVQYPLLFGLVLVFTYALLSALFYPVHFLFPENEIGQLYGEGLTKALISALFILLLWRFGWLNASGLSRLSNRRDGLVFGGILIYLVLGELYAFSGSPIPKLPGTQMTIAQTFSVFAGAFVEEIMFRALVLIAMLMAWGGSRQGMVKAVVLSSLFFGFMHLFNIMIRPVGVVLFQAVVVSLPGILYGAMLLKSSSLWPAIVVHWLTNLAVNLKVSQIDNYQETNLNWILFLIILIPTTIYSAFVLRNLPVASERIPTEEITILEAA